MVLNSGKYSVACKNGQLYMLSSSNVCIYPTDELFSFGGGRPRT